MSVVLFEMLIKYRTLRIVTLHLLRGGVLNFYHGSFLNKTSFSDKSRVC